MTSPDNEALAREIAAKAYSEVGNPHLARLMRGGHADHMPGFLAAFAALASQATIIADLRKQVGVKHDEANRYVNEMIDAKARTDTAESRISASDDAKEGGR